VGKGTSDYMSLPYKRSIATVPNLGPGLSTLMSGVGNFSYHNFYLERLGDSVHCGIGFANSMLLAELWVLKISHFWFKIGGMPTTFVARTLQYSTGGKGEVLGQVGVAEA